MSLRKVIYIFKLSKFWSSVCLVSYRSVPDVLCLFICSSAGLSFRVCKPGHLAANLARIRFQETNRNSGRHPLNALFRWNWNKQPKLNQLGLPAPSTCKQSRENFDPCQSITNPCTISSQAALGHWNRSVSIKPSWKALNWKKLSYVEYIILPLNPALRQIYNNLHQLFSEENWLYCG